MELYQKLALAGMIFFAISVSISIAYSQTNDEPCKTPEASQFDFWVGSWQLEWKDPDGTPRTGTNNITKILGSCVIEENFSTGDKSYLGKSISMYNPDKKIWQQTWVDNGGSYLDFTGGMDGDKMILQRKGKNKKGVDVLQKMTFYDITHNEFNWNWEYSTDGGVNWLLVWKIHYTRKS